MYSPKNLWNNICLLLCVPVELFWFFKMFLLLFANAKFAKFDIFCKDFSIFFWSSKTQGIDHRFYPTTENSKPMETLQTKQNWRAGHFLGSKNVWVVYTHWLYENTAQDQLVLTWLYTQNYIQNLDEGLAFANKLIDFCLDTVCFLVFWLFSTFCTICLAIVLVKRPFSTECCGDFFGFKHIY